MNVRSLLALLTVTLSWACGQGNEPLGSGSNAGEDNATGGNAGGGDATGGNAGGGNASGGNASGGNASGGNGSGGAIVPADVLFFDDFEYAVSEADDAGNLTAFQAAGWAGAKAINVTGSHGGNLYTVDNITGHGSDFPGASSSRVLCINSLAATLNVQTDFYLQYGDGLSPDALPGDVWIQFWILPNQNGSEQTGFHGREKFIYPCNGPYPCQTGKWLWLLSSSSYEPQNAMLSDGNVYTVSRDNQVGAVNYAGALDPSNRTKLGHTDTSEFIAVNRWTLVKLHYDTSTVSGTYEAWMQPRGGNWTKIAEWIDGVTPNFSWTLEPQDVGGHRAFRMPTTFPGNNITPTEDAWLYLDDFAIATGEAALPTYGN